MSDLIPSEGATWVSLVHGKSGRLAIPKPFERDIFLFETHVAGTSHIDGMQELEPHINAGDKLHFVREPDNPHDSHAIAVRTAQGVKIGYVPKADNVIFSRLMDAGKLLFGKVVSKEKLGNWVKIRMEIYLHE
jgi:hypothetical protein